MNTAKECICIECGSSYPRTSNNQKFCCYKCKYKNTTDRGLYRANANRYEARTNPNRGKGTGSQTGIGRKNHMYKNGKGLFTTYSPRIKRAFRWCNRCGKDLIDAGQYEYGIHHRDHDRNNNKFSNFELLCVVCHQQHHENWKATKRYVRKVQRLSRNGSRVQVDSKRTAPSKG